MNPKKDKKEEINKAYASNEEKFHLNFQQQIDGVEEPFDFKRLYLPKKYGEKRTYPQNWKAYNKSQTNEFSLFQDILVELIDSLLEIKEPIRGKGRPFHNLKEMIFCCVMRSYFGKSSRRSVSFLDYAVARSYIKKKPHFNTVLNYYKDLEITKVLKHLIEQSGIPLKSVEYDFAIDASGFSTTLFGRWFNVRTLNDSKKRIYKKAHITSGVKTNIISAIEVTPGYFADSPQFNELVRITANNFDMREISADKGYLSRANLEYASELGAVPYIIFKKNSKRSSKGSHIWRKMMLYYENHQSRFLRHYHKRSNAETVFHMIKRKFGSTLNSKSEIAQINEVLCKALSHNICVLIQEMFEMGIKLEFNKCAKMEIKRTED